MSAFSQVSATFRRQSSMTNASRNHRSLFELYYDI